MEKDRVTESYDWVYGWKVEDGKCVPPAKNHSLPEFVQKRIDWEFGASSDYMPVSDEYRNWLNDPILGNIRSVALMIAVIYG